MITEPTNWMVETELEKHLIKMFAPSHIYQYNLYTAMPEGMMKVLTFEWFQLIDISEIIKLPLYFEDTCHLELGTFLKYDVKLLKGQCGCHMPKIEWKYALDHWGCE